MMGRIFNPANAPLLLAMGSGFAGAGSIGSGMRRAFGNAVAPAAQLRQEQLMQAGAADTYRALVARGVSPQEAVAATRDPELKKALIARAFETKLPEWKETGRDRWGNPVHGFVNANNQTVNGQPVVPGAAGGAGSASSAPDMTLTGDEYLKTLDPPMAAQIKAIAEGRAAYPTGAIMRSPFGRMLIEGVAQYDPTFDAVNYKSRETTRKDFTAGKAAQNLTAFNTAIAHLDTLNRSIDGLNNKTFPLWNEYIANPIAGQFDPKYQDARKAFEAARTAVADELTRAFRGSGGNVHDIRQWESTINAADSPAALKSAIRQAAELLNGRIEAVGDQYNRGMGTTKDPLELLNPKAADAFRHLREARNGPAAPASSASPEKQPPIPGARQARDGRWYVEKNGEYFRVEQ
jgi:hypothetical protein